MYLSCVVLCHGIVLQSIAHGLKVPCLNCGLILDSLNGFDCNLVLAYTEFYGTYFCLDVWIIM